MAKPTNTLIQLNLTSSDTVIFIPLSVIVMMPINYGRPLKIVCVINAHFVYIGRLPYSIRVLVESALRNCDNFQVKKTDVENILNWEKTQRESIEVPFKPSRVLLQGVWRRQKLVFPENLTYLIMQSYRLYRGARCRRLCGTQRCLQGTGR